VLAAAEVAEKIGQASGAALLSVVPLGEHHARAIAGPVAYADHISKTCQLSGGTIGYERV
jgi:hypothetical protein